MSGRPEQTFYKDDIVIQSFTENSAGYMGVVVDATWDPFLRSYKHQYICQYMTGTINGQVFPKRQWYPGSCLQCLGRTPSGQRSLTAPNGHMRMYWRKSAERQILKGREGSLSGHRPALRRDSGYDLIVKMNSLLIWWGVELAGIIHL